MTVYPQDVIRCTQIATYGGSDTHQNVYYAEHQGVGALTDAVVMAGLEGEISGWMGYVTPYQTTGLVYDGVEFYNVTQDQPMGFVADSYSNQGSGGSPTLPLQCALLVSFITAVKNAVGRKYLGSLYTTVNTSAGVLSAASGTAAATWAAAVLGGVTISGELFKFGHYRPATSLFIEWLSARIDTLIRTQRRRVTGEGA